MATTEEMERSRIVAERNEMCRTAELFIGVDGHGRIPIDLNCYPDGAPLVKADELRELMSLPWARPADILSDFVFRPLTMESFVAGMFFASALTERGLNLPAMTMPLIPGARQDRLNSTGDFLFTVKDVAKMINDREFPAVRVLDAHSDVGPALIDRCYAVAPGDIFGESTFNPICGVPTAVVSPDGGAEKRAMGVAKNLGVPLIHGWKSRDVSTGKISGFGCEPIDPEVHGLNYLFVDDLCDGGGTFMGLSEAVTRQQPGACCHLYVTHGLFTKGTTELRKYFDKIITTDSIVRYSDDPNLTILRWTAR